MGYGIRDGDIIALNNPKAGALTLSQPLHDFRPTGGLDPYDLWATQPAVRTVIGFIARSVASIPFHVYQGEADGGKTIDPTSPVHQALHAPWPKQGQGRFIEALVNDLYIFGRWGFLAMPNGNGGYEFPKLKGNRFSAVVDGFGRYEGIAIWPKDQSAPEVIPIEDVVFDFGPEPIHGDHRYGSTSVATLDDLAHELQALGEYRADLFTNGARVPAVIERPSTAPKWSDDAWGRFKTEFATYKAGGGNAGGTPILEDGMTYRTVDSVSPKDAQYVEVRKLALEEAAEALHVPPELVGARQGTYSNILALREQLYQDVLGPLIKWTQEAMNVGLAHLLDEGEEIRADVDSKLRTDQATRAKIYQTTVGSPIQTVNEARAEQGWPSIDGGDELVTPLNVTTGGLASPNDTGQTNEPDPSDPLPDLEAGGPPEPLGKASAPDRGVKTTAGDSGSEEETDEGDPAVPYAEDDPEPVQKAIRAMTGRLSDLGEKIRGVLADRVGEKADTSVMTDQELAAWTKEAMSVLTDSLPPIASASSTATLDQLGVSTSVWSAAAQKAWIDTAAASYAELLIKERIAAMVTGTGDTARAAVEAIPATVNNMAAGIGTEVTSFGANDAAKAADATHKTWKTTSSNPRPTHAALDGVTIPVDQEFSNRLRWPGDWTGSGPETANCRCRITYSKDKS